jgi:hypothetical protein
MERGTEQTLESYPEGAEKRKRERRDWMRRVERRKGFKE